MRTDCERMLIGMKTHESMDYSCSKYDYLVTRVIGGWIYRAVKQGQLENGIFIPEK